MPAFYTVSGMLLGIAAMLTPHTQDPLLFATDLKFGIAPSWAIGGLFHSQPWLALLCEFVYFSLPVATAWTLAILIVIVSIGITWCFERRVEEAVWEHDRGELEFT